MKLKIEFDRKKVIILVGACVVVIILIIVSMWISVISFSSGGKPREEAGLKRSQTRIGPGVAATSPGVVRKSVPPVPQPEVKEAFSAVAEKFPASTQSASDSLVITETEEFKPFSEEKTESEEAEVARKWAELSESVPQVKPLYSVQVEAEHAEKTESVDPQKAESVDPQKAASVDPQKAEFVDPQKAASVPQAKPLYSLQVGAFRYKKNAERFLGQLKQKGYTAYIFAASDPKARQWHTVRIGDYKTRAEALAAKKDFKAKEKRPAFITKFNSLLSTPSKKKKT